MSAASRLRGLVPLLAAGATGCVLLDVAEQQELAEQAVVLRGQVSGPEPDSGPLVTALVHWPAGGGAAELVDHYVSPRAGSFYFSTTRPGRYSLPAFVDADGDRRLDPGEPGIPTTPANTFELGRGETRASIELHIDENDRIPTNAPIDIRELQARSADDQTATTMGQLTVVGEVVDIDDPRFDPENGKMGFWRPYDFIFEAGAGVYFLEPYAPERTPVLFVHGALGTPRDFAYLIERLDRERFQPWVYYYPSGAKLTRVDEHLSQALVQLEQQYGLRRMLVVAHSMGGLVARGFLLHHVEDVGSGVPRLLVTLATPWGGFESARLGVERSPAVVYSWRDVAPGGAYLHELFHREPYGARRHLPPTVPHHMLFAHRRDETSFGWSSDGVVDVASQLRPEAQDEAASIYGYDETHVGILRDAGVAERLNQLLRAAD